MEALLVFEPPNILPPSENAVGTAIILDFYYSSVATLQNRVLLTKSPNFQGRCLLGYRCAPGVTIFCHIFLDTFLHLLNVKTGTINCARILNLYAFDRELNSTPFHSAQIFKLVLVCAIIVLKISFVY